MDRPNILFLIADDHRFSAVNALGLEAVATPTLDQLKADGTILTNVHIMGSTSDAVCMPSRGMLMTGRNLFSTPDPLPDEAPLLPQLLWQGGYTTFATGKWHNRPETFARSFSTGGKVFFGGMSDDQYAFAVYDFDPSRAYPDSACTIVDTFSTTLFADEVISFLESYPSDHEPFFAYVAFTSPHDPRTPPPPYDTMYDPNSIALPPNYMAQHPFDLGIQDIRDEMLAEQPRQEAEIRQHIADYYGMISHMDFEIGRVLQALDDNGLRDNTLVIYTSDHGLAVGQHGLMGKQTLYDHSIRVPLIMRGPGIEANKEIDALCYLFDLFPTICERTGVALPETNEGYSLNALIDGYTTVHRRSVFAAYQSECGHPAGRPYQRMVKSGRYKLIQSCANDIATTQLFDIEDDPYELVNLYPERRYLQIVQSLEKQLGDWQVIVRDPLLHNEGK